LGRSSQLSHQHLLPLVSTLATEIVPTLVRELGRFTEDGAKATGVDGPKMSNLCQHDSKAHGNDLPLSVLSEQCIQACLELNKKELYLWCKGQISQGLDIEVLYLDVIPQAIRSLHDLWEEDQVSFLDVTRATWNIKRLLYTLSPEFIQPHEETLIPQLNRFQAIICAAPGSQHTLGPLLVSQFLQRKGWLVVPGIDHSEKEVLELVSERWVDLFCVSISLRSEIPRLRSWIQKVRSKSKNIYIQCVVGGSLLNFEPKLQSLLGADAATSSPRDLHNLGVKLVKVHRKVRKLNFQSVEELTQAQFVHSKPDLQQDESRFTANLHDMATHSKSKSERLAYSGPESSNSESFNPKRSNRKNKSAGGLDV